MTITQEEPVPTIRVDDEVYAFLQDQAKAFVDSPNDVLRRLLLGEVDPAPANRSNESADRAASRESAMRMRRDASGLGDDERYLRGMQATIYRGGYVYKRSGVRSPRGADLNQLQTWIAELVGLRNPSNATLIQNLRSGSTREAIGDVVVVVEPQLSTSHPDPR